MMLSCTLLLFTSIVSHAFTFVPPKLTQSRRITAAPSAALSMAPKFIGRKWVAQSDAEEPEAGYDIFGTLLRQGPEPALSRIFSPDDYEQAVLKFMATEKCDRMTAQGNMDAYLRNPQDWAFSRMEEERRGIKRDYVTIQPKEVALVLVWSAFVSAVVGRAAYCITNGVDFYAFGPFTGSY